MENVRVVVADDNIQLRELIAGFLSEQAGVEVAGAAANGMEALKLVEDTEPDVLICDMIMPQMDGYTVLERLQGMRLSHRPGVIALTALGRDDFIARAINLGVHYYMVKPFAFEELSARLRVLTRRSRQTTNTFELADLVVDADKRSVTRGGRAVTLTSREYAMLEYMIRNKGYVLTREQMIAHVWSYDYEGASNMVDVYIRNLRKKIDDGQEKKLIHTVRYMGYVLREDA